MTTRRSLLVALIGALAVLASACSSGSSDADSSSTSTTLLTSESGPTTTGPLGSGTSPIPDAVRIEVLSSQPDRVSGDDARVRITPASDQEVADLQVLLNDVDITAALPLVDGALEGVISGLIEGNNTLVAKAADEQAIQRIRAWPITGPVISGPHLPLLACSTEAQGLGPATDADCSAATRVTWSYVNTNGSIVALPNLTQPPTDLATATIDGTEVPLYVRLERGVINRSVYEIASIDTTPGDDEAASPGWNGKLLYRYGGTCGTTFGQGAPATPAASPTYLKAGYAVATASFNNFDVQCNDVLSAETTMMVKERVIEEYGVPDFTIGEGASDGASQLHLMAQNYPGLVNGVVASEPFADTFSTLSGATDCGLLQHYYDTPAGAALTEAQRTAINGHATAKTCQNWQARAGVLDPTDGCDPQIPASAIYDPATNRGGLRCTVQDANRNQLAPDAATGWATRPLDNVGLQYGLEALNAGTITFEQFIDLNTSIGGYDIDGQIVADRHEADPEAVMHAYETGRISMGGGDQFVIPIIDIDVYTDPAGDIHDRFRAFSLRDRNFSARTIPGFQIWTRPAGRDWAPSAVTVMDEWLTALRADDDGGDMAEVLVRTRPEAAIDNCLPAGATEPVSGEDTYTDDGPCKDQFPIAGDPRIAAGAPRSDEILKCTLKPVDPSDYEVQISADQLAALRDAFPQGVCDWLSAGEGELIPANPDRSYEDVPSPGQSI